MDLPIMRVPALLCRYLYRNRLSERTSSFYFATDVAIGPVHRNNAMDDLNIKSAVIDALAAVTDESSGKSIIDAHLLEAVDVKDGVVDIKLKVPADLSKDARWDLEDNVADAVEAVEGVGDVNVHMFTEGENPWAEAEAEAAKSRSDESSGKSIIDAHLLEAVDVKDGVVDIKLKVPADLSKDARWDLEDNVADAVEAVEGVGDVNVHMFTEGENPWAEAEAEAAKSKSPAAPA